MVSHGLTWSHMVSHGLTWSRMVSHGLTIQNALKDHVVQVLESLLDSSESCPVNLRLMLSQIVQLSNDYWNKKDVTLSARFYATFFQVHTSIRIVSSLSHVNL